MKKTVLEVFINKKAKELYEKDIKEFIKFLEENPIAKNLIIKKQDKDTFLLYQNYNTGDKKVIITLCDDEINKDITNIGDIEKELIQKYEDEILKEILDKQEKIENIQTGSIYFGSATLEIIEKPKNEFPFISWKFPFFNIKNK